MASLETIGAFTGSVGSFTTGIVWLGSIDQAGSSSLHRVMWLVDIILHAPAYLESFAISHGAWVYALLFSIIFAETGFVFLPFLPGDSLLFVTGALTAQPQFGLSVTLMWVLLTVAAVAGDALNYAAGHSLGPAVFHLVDDAPAATSDWKSLYTKLTRPRASFKERFHALVRHGLKKDHLTSAQAFYAKHGGKAIVLARFFPVLRSFAPFVAGVTDMAYPSFLRYNCIGGFAWITAFLLAGYYLGHIPGVQSNFKLIILLLIAVSFIPLIITSYKSKKEAIDAKEVKAKAANSSYQRPVFVAEV